MIKIPRASGPKVRTGCLTCKRRHLKCDERKPECIRCTGTGRICEGYSYPDSNKAKSPDKSSPSVDSPTYLPPRQLQLGTAENPKELRSIELFFVQAAPKLSGYFQASFWKFVLQVSFTEPSIRHALVAISAVYEEECIMTKPNPGAIALKELSLHHYNRALRCLRAKLRRNDSIVVPLTGCLLFICVEFLRQNVQTANKHITGAIGMIEQARMASKVQSTLKIAYSPYEMELVERVLAPLVSSLNITAVVLGRPNMYFYCRDGLQESWSFFTRPINTIEEALASLMNLTHMSIQFIHEAGEQKYTTGQLEPSCYFRQRTLLRMQESWKEKFDDFKTRHSEFCENDIVRSRRNILQIWYLMMHLWIQNCCSIYETSWDLHRSDFEELLHLTQQVIDGDSSRFPDGQFKLFSFELGVILPLDFIARKCRYSNLRRQALSMLQKTPKKECLFESTLVAVLNERIIDLEETDLNLLPGQIPGDDHLPSEQSRILLTFFAYEEVPELEAWPVSFLSKPRGPGEDWLIRKEFLKIKTDTFERNLLRKFIGIENEAYPSHHDEGNKTQFSIPMLTPLGYPIVEIATPVSSPIAV